jgi:putative transposase
VLDEGKSVGRAARDLDLTETALRAWVNRARADRTHRKTGLTTAEREELARRSLLRERAAVKFRFIAAQKAHHSLTRLCRCLRLTRSGFYAWRDRPESARATRDRQLKVLVRSSFMASKGRYGSPRIYLDLLENHHERVSRKRVIRWAESPTAETLQVHNDESDHDQPVAANLLDREFTADGPNHRWVGDTTEFVIGQSGKLYLAAILDLFSRFVIGWAVSAVNDRHLTLKALHMALKRRCPDAGLLHHSDQGSTDASEDYQHVLDAHGITCSMSRRGDCYDNAVMEAFFSSVKARRPIGLPASVKPRWSCSTTSRCSISSAVDTRHSAKSVRPNSNDAR